jgi:phage baseplate assembly protein W
MADLKFPLTVVNKNLALAKHPSAEKVLSVLSTAKGERVYRPEYGTPVALFDPSTQVQFELSVENVQYLLQLYADRIEATVFEIIE